MHWLPVAKSYCQVHFKLATLMFKTLHDSAPPVLTVSARIFSAAAPLEVGMTTFSPQSHCHPSIFQNSAYLSRMYQVVVISALLLVVFWTTTTSL